VRIATVTALHSNGLDPDYIGGDLGKAMKEAGIAGDVGLATGYVLRFSNGLVVYLSGDTGIVADQEVVVRNHYNAKLAVMNIGDGFTTGPVEAAYVINELVKPASVIPSHANEVGTVNGKVRPGSKTEAFMKAVKMPAHIPLSGETMEFDATGKCTAGAEPSRVLANRGPHSPGHCGSDSIQLLSLSCAGGTKRRRRSESTRRVAILPRPAMSECWPPVWRRLPRTVMVAEAVPPVPTSAYAIRPVDHFETARMIISFSQRRVQSAQSRAGASSVLIAEFLVGRRRNFPASREEYIQRLRIK